MIYYGIAAIFPLIMWFIYEHIVGKNQYSDKEKLKLRTWLTVFSIAPMFLLFVLRYKYVGVDTIGYVKFFQNEIREYSFLELFNKELMRTEIGYRIYVKIISLFTDNYTVYFLINGIVIFGTLLHFSKKYTDNPFIFFFMFITLGTYQFVETGLRQALAMMICLWAIDFLKDKKIIRFILVVALASLFHTSAWLFLLLLPLFMIKRLDWTIATHVIMALVFFVGFSFFHNTFIQWLGYDTYYIDQTGNGGIFFVFVLVLFAFSLFMTYNRTSKIEGQSLIVHMAILTVTFWLLRLISRTAERVSFYYIFGLYIYFSQSLSYYKDKLTTLMKVALIAACFFLFVYRNVNISYVFFWGGV